MDFIISDESIFPIHDKAHAIAARLILADAEISDDDKNTVLEIIDEKLGILVGDKFSLSDELEKLKHHLQIQQLLRIPIVQIRKFLLAMKQLTLLFKNG